MVNIDFSMHVKQDAGSNKAPIKASNKAPIKAPKSENGALIEVLI